MGVSKNYQGGEPEKYVWRGEVVSAGVFCPSTKTSDMGTDNAELVANGVPADLRLRWILPMGKREGAKSAEKRKPLKINRT